MHTWRDARVIAAVQQRLMCSLREWLLDEKQSKRAAGALQAAMGRAESEWTSCLQNVLNAVSKQFPEMSHSPCASLKRNQRAAPGNATAIRVPCQTRAQMPTESIVELQLHLASQPMAQIVLKEGRRACSACYRESA